MFYYLQQHCYNVTLEEETKCLEGPVASWEIHGKIQQGLCSQTALNLNPMLFSS